MIAGHPHQRHTTSRPAVEPDCMSVTATCWCTASMITRQMAATSTTSTWSRVGPRGSFQRAMSRIQDSRTSRVHARPTNDKASSRASCAAAETASTAGPASIATFTRGFPAAGRAQPRRLHRSGHSSGLLSRDRVHRTPRAPVCGRCLSGRSVRARTRPVACGRTPHGLRTAWTCCRRCRGRPAASTRGRNTFPTWGTPTGPATAPPA